MPELIRIKPAPGLLVRDPATRQPLPQEGMEVPRSAHWIRRLNAGDVVLCAAEAAPATTKPAAKAAKE